MKRKLVLASIVYYWVRDVDTDLNNVCVRRELYYCKSKQWTSDANQAADLTGYSRTLMYELLEEIAKNSDNEDLLLQEQEIYVRDK